MCHICYTMGCTMTEALLEKPKRGSRPKKPGNARDVEKREAGEVCSG